MCLDQYLTRMLLVYSVGYRTATDQKYSLIHHSSSLHRRSTHIMVCCLFTPVEVTQLVALKGQRYGGVGAWWQDMGQG